MPNLGLTELLVIGGIALLLFGTRLPKVGKSLGEGIRNFKKGLSGEDEKVNGASEGSTTASLPQDAAQMSPDAPPQERPRVSMAVAPTSLSGAQAPSGNAGSVKRETVVDVEHGDTNHNPSSSSK